MQTLSKLVAGFTGWIVTLNKEGKGTQAALLDAAVSIAQGHGSEMPIERLAGLMVGGVHEALASRNVLDMAALVGFFNAYAAKGGDTSDEAIQTLAEAFAKTLDDNGNIIEEEPTGVYGFEADGCVHGDEHEDDFEPSYF